jgi:predicted neutral ceramidase superfamily lipid hydrolase
MWRFEAGVGCVLSIFLLGFFVLPFSIWDPHSFLRQVLAVLAGVVIWGGLAALFVKVCVPPMEDE